ncbi:hypothetical protein COX00_02290 [Candidatus Uhrbacteria bacterium CG22_combo_CG10-13_8_21_14_all_47_17]|uniref:Uncharacterized protein n=1 Tax=Candidatus Uhrbacteria bacterium CG22_combo_CG10-13_8_21_14_all_47_17 TaxID=1975041 RepID=A0A2H0BSG1_9BACT|nr:MAG: hypothetical protein COX00_02290 [Candidatus Uhrbacteria bacterium CG22_combo_CG10-13_8_21_14_all_47_17]
MAETYNIGSGLSEQELDLASFWVRNRSLLQKISHGLLIGFSVLTWGFVLWSLLDAYAISYPREARITQIVANNQLAIQGLESSRPKTVQSSEVSVFSATDGREDFLVELTNPNAQWMATFTYQFNSNGELTPQREGYILPNSQRYLTELGFTPQKLAPTARLVVDNIQWRRVNPNEVDGNYQDFAARRLLFDFANIDFQKTVTLANQDVGQSSFDFTNQSAYGYWNVDLTVVLFRGTIPVGVTTITEHEVKPGEQRPVTINWFENPSGITKTEVQANTNIFDPNNYLEAARF